MVSPDILKRATQLREKLEYHNHRYYVLDDPEIPMQNMTFCFGNSLLWKQNIPNLTIPILRRAV